MTVALGAGQYSMPGFASPPTAKYNQVGTRSSLSASSGSRQGLHGSSRQRQKVPTEVRAVDMIERSSPQQRRLLEQAAEAERKAAAFEREAAMLASRAKLARDQAQVTREALAVGTLPANVPSPHVLDPRILEEPSPFARSQPDWVDGAASGWRDYEFVESVRVIPLSPMAPQEHPLSPKGPEMRRWDERPRGVAPLPEVALPDLNRTGAALFGASEGAFRTPTRGQQVPYTPSMTTTPFSMAPTPPSSMGGRPKTSHGFSARPTMNGHHHASNGYANGAAGPSGGVAPRSPNGTLITTIEDYGAMYEEAQAALAATLEEALSPLRNPMPTPPPTPPPAKITPIRARTAGSERSESILSGMMAKEDGDDEEEDDDGDSLGLSSLEEEAATKRELNSNLDVLHWSLQVEGRRPPPPSSSDDAAKKQSLKEMSQTTNEIYDDAREGLDAILLQTRERTRAIKNKLPDPVLSLQRSHLTTASSRASTAGSGASRSSVRPSYNRQAKLHRRRNELISQYWGGGAGGGEGEQESRLRMMSMHGVRQSTPLSAGGRSK